MSFRLNFQPVNTKNITTFSNFTKGMKAIDITSIDAEEIIKNLQATTYKFTYANKVRSELMQLDRARFSLLKVELQRYMQRPENANLKRSIEEIIR